MMQRLCLLLVCTLLLVLPAFSPSFVTAADPTTEFQQGQQLYQSGNLQRSLAVLRTFVQRNPQHPQVPQAYGLTLTMNFD